jgi:hypothetical protein
MKGKPVPALIRYEMQFAHGPVKMAFGNDLHEVGRRDQASVFIVRIVEQGDLIVSRTLICPVESGEFIALRDFLKAGGEIGVGRDLQ